MLSDRIHHGKVSSRHTATIYPSGDLTLSVRTQRSPKPDKSDPDQDFPNMGLSDATISHNPSKPLSPRTRKGQLGITPMGKRMLRSAAAILALFVSRVFMTFCTVTTPTITPEENLIINQNWSELTRQLIQWISRQLVKAGINPDISYCIEGQEQRFIETGIYALHLHIVFQGRKGYGYDWVIKPAAIDAEWQRLLENLLDRPVDVSASNKLEKPRGDLAKEIGKYQSKGGKLVLKEIPKELLPTAWWGMTRSLKAKILKAIIKFVDSTATWLWDNTDDLPIKYRLVCLSEKYGNYPVGKVGWIADKSFLEQLVSIAEPHWLQCKSV